MAGTLFVVATPIGNLEDITARALRVLREVALIAAEDTRRTANLLARYGIGTKTTSLHEHNERGKTATLIARLEAGDSIALVSDAGTPTISDPGAHLVSEAVKKGVRTLIAVAPPWSQAKALWWRNPWLLKLRRLVVNPPAPGAFGRARREPRRMAVSTLEAVAYALAELEGDKALAGRLIAPLHVLVKKQAQISASTAGGLR